MIQASRTVSWAPWILLSLFYTPIEGFVAQKGRLTPNTSRLFGENDKECCQPDRRKVIATLFSASALIPVASQATVSDLLTRTRLGEASWSSQTTAHSLVTNFPPSFCTYLTRFLLNYDSSFRQYWQQLEESLSLLRPEQQTSQQTQHFSRLARSVSDGIQSLTPAQLYERLETQYGLYPDAPRQLALLFTLLPDSQQPTAQLEKSKTLGPTTTTSTIVDSSLTELLSSEYSVVKTSTSSFSIDPPLKLFQVGYQSDKSVVLTPFGAIANAPLTREQPVFDPIVYTKFGLAGATGCALTHSVVIPLDVVKTRAQTAIQAKTSMLDQGKRILETEGVSGLFLGAQATLVGYFWYGCSVYPSYTFFKKFLTDAYDAAYAVAHGNEIALIAGALAAVIASLGLTPIEAARIRVVAEPDVYRPLGLIGTLGVLNAEGGLGNLYAGLPSLLTRQVLFGSVKFLIFERTSEYIFGSFPILYDATWTSLGVSLVAGGISGVISSAISQPADSVLTYVAKKSQNTGIWQGAVQMVQDEGIGSLFRGLGSRCVWAGSIIAGQFLLYDVFRGIFRVSTEDLTQVFQISITP